MGMYESVRSAGRKTVSYIGGLLGSAHRWTITHDSLYKKQMEWFGKRIEGVDALAEQNRTRGEMLGCMIDTSRKTHALLHDARNKIAVGDERIRYLESEIGKREERYALEILATEKRAGDAEARVLKAEKAERIYRGGVRHKISEMRNAQRQNLISFAEGYTAAHPDAFVVAVGIDDGIAYASDSALKLLDLPTEEVVGRDAYNFISADRELKNLVKRKIGKALSERDYGDASVTPLNVTIRNPVTGLEKEIDSVLFPRFMMKTTGSLDYLGVMITGRSVLHELAKEPWFTSWANRFRRRIQSFVGERGARADAAAAVARAKVAAEEVRHMQKG